MRRIFFSLLFAVLVSGCASSYLQKPAEYKNHPGKISYAKVVWIEPSGGVPYRLSKTAAGYGYTPAAPTITDRERREAGIRITQVMDTYRSFAPEYLMKRLSGYGVKEGNETIIRIKPIAANIQAYNGAVNILFEVSVKHADAIGDWIIQPVSSNFFDGAYWNIARPSGIGEKSDVDLTKLVESFADTTVREMNKSAWFIDHR